MCTHQDAIIKPQNTASRYPLAGESFIGLRVQDLGFRLSGSGFMV